MNDDGRSGEQTSDGDGERSDLTDDFDEFLAGIRTSLPGVQVLVAFLLVLPLQAGFTETDDLERAVFAFSLVTSVLGAGLLIAPSVHQRVRAPMTGLKRRSHSHVVTAVWLTIVGTVLTNLALTSVTFLATSFVFDRWIAITVAASVGTVLATTWFVLPLMWRR